MGKRQHNGENTNYPSTPAKKQKVADCDQPITANGLLNSSNVTDIGSETPPQFCLTKDLVDGTVLVDLNLQKWRVGKPIGKFVICMPALMVVVIKHNQLCTYHISSIDSVGENLWIIVCVIIREGGRERVCACTLL